MANNMLLSKCDNCGNEGAYARLLNNRTALYCSKCNGFIRWVKMKELHKLSADSKKVALDGKAEAFKRYIINEKTKVVTVRCSNCRCRFYNSNSKGAAAGIFDLRDANYCPKCGARLV